MSNIRFLDQVSVKSFDPSAPAITKGDTGEQGLRGPEAYFAAWTYNPNNIAGVDIPASGSFLLDTTWSSNTSLLSLASYSTSPTNEWASILDKVSVGTIVKLSSQNNPDIYKYLEIQSIAQRSGYYELGVNDLLTNSTANTNELIGIGFQYFYDSATTAFPYTGSADISGSLNVIGFSTLQGSLSVQGSENEDIATFKDSNGDDKVSINSEGVVVFSDRTDTPVAISGGLMYSSSVFWFGM